MLDTASMIKRLLPPFCTASVTNDTEGKKPPGKIHFWIKSCSLWSIDNQRCVCASPGAGTHIARIATRGW